MQNKRRKSIGAMDGFVPRNKAHSPRRSSLDVTSKRPKRPAMDGFVQREASRSNTLAQQQESSDSWSDENTLNIGDEPLQQPQGTHRRRRMMAGSEQQPKWWQFGKKRRLKKGKPEPSPRRKLVKRIILIIILTLVLIGGFLGWSVIKNATRVFNGNILGLLNTTKLRGEERGRVNILLAGNSADDDGHDGADLTDSIMVASIDTKDNSAFMFSIPRDLYVDYETRECSIGYKGKINAAYVCGEQIKFKESGYPEGGMGLLAKVVHENFGIDIDYHALVNYSAFRESVDAVGGITINIESTDKRGIYDPSLDYTSRNCCAIANYPNGPVKLNGKQALNLARARGDNARAYGFARGDFMRTEHQRKMLLALKDKALSGGVLSNPAKIASLFDSIGENVTTDFDLSELRRLYDIGKKIESKNIQSIGLTDDGVSLVTTDSIPGAGSVVVPVDGITNFTKIKAYIKKLTSSDPIVREGPEVAVLNASGARGLAQEKADELTVKGIEVSTVGNADSREQTIIVDLTNGGKQSTKAYLLQKYGISSVTPTSQAVEARNYKVDFVIILGTDSAETTEN